MGRYGRDKAYRTYGRTRRLVTSSLILWLVCGCWDPCMRDRLTCIFGPRLASRVLHKHARDPGPARPSKPQPKNPARLLSGDPGAARPSKPQPKNSARLLSGTQLYMYISTLDPSRSAPPCALDGSRKGAFGFQRLVLDPKARFPRLWSV